MDLPNLFMPDFEPWGEEEAAEACIGDAIVPAEEVQEALKLLLAGENEAAAGLLARSINIAAYYGEASTDLQGWNHLKAVIDGRKGGETNREDIDQLHREWCNTRDKMKSKNKGMSMRAIARAIERDQEDCYYAHRPDPKQKYTFEQIRKVISKKQINN